MGWDRGYYYRVRKVNGRVEREYIGGGVIGQLAAELDTQERQERQQKTAAESAVRTEQDGLDARVDELSELTDRLTCLALRALGYHDHKGQWRKRRVQRNDDGSGNSCG